MQLASNTQRAADLEDFDSSMSIRTTLQAIREKNRPDGQKRPHASRNSGDSDQYRREYIKAAVAVLGAIDLDPASRPAANELVGASESYSITDDGVTRSWGGRIWLNPPDAPQLRAQFCARLVQEYANGTVIAACVLVNNATETRWFQRLAAASSAICFPRGRARSWHPDKPSSPLQGQAIFYLGDKVGDFRREFSPFGLVMEPSV